MKIDLGGPSIEIGFGDIANIIIMTKIRELDQRISKLEKIKAEKPEPGPVDDMGIYPKEIRDKEIGKSFYWTNKRDKIIKENFNELGASGIFDKSLLPGFSLTQIRTRCQDLGLIDQYGNSKVKHGAGPDS
jgi:hypothetical protein